MEKVQFYFYLIILVGCGILTACIHKKNGYSLLGGFLWGFFFNIIGVVIVLTELTKEEQKEADKGHLSMKQWLAIFLGIGIGLIALFFILAH